MSVESLSSSDNAKLKYVIDEGLKVTQQIEDLKEGLRDTVKAVAEELDIPAKAINGAIRSAHKSSIEDQKESLGTVENILTLVGKI